MSTNTHDNLCDWQPCEMCVETGENVQVKALRQIASYPSGYKFSGVVSDDNPVGRDREEMIHLARSALREIDKPTPCCPDCDNDDREQPPVPNFEDDWVRSTPLRRRLIERDDAYYFWLKGQQAGRVAEQVETRSWLRQMIEGYSERMGR